MIKLQDYTPEVYYKESRDFQFIGRLYDLVLNYVKTNADLLYFLPISNNSDDQFIELMALTLGFKPKHNYTAKHLRAVCSIFSEILRNKGTIRSILLACRAIFYSEGIDQEVDYELKDDNKRLVLYLPPQLKDTTLINDLFDYILPAGMSCSIVKLIQINTDAATKVAVQDSFKIYSAGDSAPRSPANKNYLYKDSVMSVLPRYTDDPAIQTNRIKGIVNTTDVATGDIKDTISVLPNNIINKLTDNSADEDSNEEDNN